MALVPESTTDPKQAPQTGSDRSLDSLAGRLVHKLRNPLSVITTAASQLEECPGIRDNDDDAAFLRAITAAADALENILERFLQFADRLHPQPAVVDLNDLCRSEADRCRLEWSKIQPGIEITTDLDTALPNITCDPALLRRALANILQNARESISGEGRITLRTARDGNTGVVILKDTGEGLPDDLAGSACRPFVSGKPGHAGLGLAVAERMVTLHGGAFEITRGKDRGTIVTITLPLDGGKER